MSAKIHYEPTENKTDDGKTIYVKHTGERGRPAHFVKRGGKYHPVKA